MPGIRSGASSATHTPSCTLWQVAYQPKVQIQCAELTTNRSGFSSRNARPSARSPSTRVSWNSGVFCAKPSVGTWGTMAAAMTPRSMRYPRSGSLRFGLALGQVGKDFRAAVGCRQAAEQKAKVDHPLQLLPARAGAPCCDRVQRSGVAQIHQQHAKQHQLGSFHIEALGVHAVLADALLQIEHLRVQRAGDIEPRLDARRDEADQLLIDRRALRQRLFFVGVFAHRGLYGLGIYAWWQHEPPGKNSCERIPAGGVAALGAPAARKKFTCCISRPGRRSRARPNREKREDTMAFQWRLPLKPVGTRLMPRRRDTGL